MARGVRRIRRHAHRRRRGRARREREGARPAPGKASLPIADYAGRYTDAWYGPIDIRNDKGGLRIGFTRTPGMVGRLEHAHHDTFRAVWDDPNIEPAYVTFGLDAEGKIARVTMKAVSPIADFSFDYQDLDFVPTRKQ